MTGKAARLGAGDQPTEVATGAGNGRVTGCSCSVMTLSSPHGEIVVLSVAGEVDLLSHATLEAALSVQLDARPRYLVVDLSGMTFCGVRGFTLLAAAEAMADAHEIGYAVSGLPRRLDHIAALLWAEGRPTRYRTAAGAATAIRAS